jgi:excisionase family DNA binding protein
MKDYNLNQLLTRKEAAQFLGVRENTLATWVTNKRYNLHFYKVGRLVKYKISDLEKFVQENQRGGKDV